MATEKMLWMVAQDLFRASTEMAKALCHGWPGQARTSPAISVCSLNGSADPASV